MGDQMIVFEAIKTTGQAITSMIQCVRSKKAVRKQDIVICEEQLRFIKAAFREKACGEMTRISIDEMERTIHRIEEKNFSGDMVLMSLELLNLQHQGMCKIIRSFID